MYVPTSDHTEWAGVCGCLKMANKRLMVIVPISLVLILVMLYSLFNSWRDSFMALLGIPFSIAGGIIALYVSDLNFSISAAIGFVSLFGVSVMSGILIISCYNQIAGTGLRTIEAMTKAVAQQMRPIIMMALSACIGLFPGAISTASRSHVQRPPAPRGAGGMAVRPI